MSDDPVLPPDSARLRFDRWDPERHAEAAHRLYGDPEVTRYIGGTTCADVASTRALLDDILRRMAAQPAGMGGFPAFDADGELVAVGLIKRLPGPDRAVLTDDVEIGWHVRRDRWGRGLATEVGAALRDHGWRHFGLDTLWVVVEPPNTASIRVAEKLGARPIGRTTRYYGGLELETLRLMRP